MKKSNKPKKKHPILKVLLILFLILLAALAAGGIYLFKEYKQYTADTANAQNEVIGQTAPDFTVTTTDGTVYTLSEILKEKEVVVLNVFASWCGPCEAEFPEFEAVYQEHKNNLEILALSGDDADTMEDMTTYKADHNLSFPIGLCGEDVTFVPSAGFPTTVIIDRNMKVMFCQSGTIRNRETFEKLVTTFMGDSYDGSPVYMYSLSAYSSEAYVENVTVKITADDGTETTLTSDENGSAVLMVREPHTYTVEVVSVPEGYSVKKAASSVGPESNYISVQLDKK